ncbi:MAG: hypothetical protein ABJB03_11375 [Rhodoglobus sp.]
MAIVVAVLFGLFGLMYSGWRGRRKRQAGIPKPESVPADLGQALGEFEGFYVATTSAGKPLDRIAVRGLGFRARCSVSVAVAGLVVHLPGDDVFIPAGDVRDFTEATWTIDRAVEEKGLQLVAWTLGATPVDSYFRMDEPQAFAQAVDAMRSTERTTS